MRHKFLDRLPISWTLKFAVLRLMAQWRSLLTVIIGVLLAGAIGSNIPLYTSAVSQIGMIERLEQQPDETIHITTRITHRGTESSTLATFWNTAESDVRLRVETILRDSAFPNWVNQVVSTAETAAFDYTDTARLRLATASNWRDQVVLTAGEFPGDATNDAHLEAVMSAVAANELGIAPDDMLTLTEAGSGASIRVRISGLVQAGNANSPYWIAPSPLRIDRDLASLETNLLTDRTTLEQVIRANLPEGRTRLGWKVLFDYTQLRFEDTAQVITVLDEFREDIRDLFETEESGSLSLIYENDVIPVLEDYREEVARLNAPFGLLLLQIGALVLLFLVVIVALVRRGERREIAMLQSRGAYDYQIMLVRGVEALIVCALATLVAPWLARQVLVWLVPSLVNVERLQLAVGLSAYLYAGIAALAALVILVMTLRPVLNLPLISAGGSALRDDRQPWWQRYYLDVVLMGFGLLGLWRLLDSNSALVETQSGVSRADPLLLLTPALLFVAIGSLLLRLFPLSMALFTRLVTRRRGLGGVLAGWQVSREPVHYARITFLLALAIGIGWFATSFQATIVRSQSDQARYQVGADLRISEYDSQLERPATRPIADYRAIDGVESVTQVRRFDDIPAAVNAFSFDPGELLAVNFESFTETAYWRDDLGTLDAPYNESYPRLAIEDNAEPLPFTPERVRLRVLMPQPVINEDGNEIISTSVYRLVRGVTISLSLRDDTGDVFQLVLNQRRIEGDLTDEERFLMMEPSFDGERWQEIQDIGNRISGWVTFSGDFTNLDYTPQGEMTLQGIDITNNSFSDGTPTELLLDSLQLIDANGDAQTLDTLTNVEWFLQADMEEMSIEIVETPDSAQSESVLVRWLTDANTATIALSRNPDLPNNRIPVLASRAFLEINNLEIGLEFPMALLQQDYTFVIIGETNFYPTLYQEVGPFLVADFGTVQSVIFNATGNFIQPNETWLDLAPAVSESAIVQAIQLGSDRYRVEAVASFQEALDSYVTDPLSLGLIGLLFLSFVVVLMLSIISLLTYAGLTAQFRRSEFGVLQALGISRIRIVLSMALEQILVTGIAVLIGAVIGIILSTQVLPTLASSITTRTITPPFVVRTETIALLQYGVVLAMVLVVVLVFTMVLIQRLSLAQAIKMGEE